MGKWLRQIELSGRLRDSNPHEICRASLLVTEFKVRCATTVAIVPRAVLPDRHSRDTGLSDRGKPARLRLV
jgi:hypothetical protein